MELIDLDRDDPEAAFAYFEQEYAAGEATRSLCAILYRLQTDESSIATLERLLGDFLKGKPELPA